MPVFKIGNQVSDSGKKAATPLPAITNTPLIKEPTVSRLTDSERRTRSRHSDILSTPSISGMMNGSLPGVSEPAHATMKRKEIPKEQPFDSAQLTKAWKAFADTVDAAQLKSALSVREPILVDNFRVEYNLDNEVQRHRIVQDLKPKLLACLQKVLQNDQIYIEFKVVENLEEIKNKPYTDQEKFNSLMEKYPVLGVMKQRFGLDF
ncbi:MAG: hypothetical protein M1292_05395 [Bacteroidetes bacterium]|nr:hypothetical protein [Bacteroidota bacterium]